MRIKTILLAGVTMAALLAVIGFYFGHEPASPAVPPGDDGYLAAINPPPSLELTTPAIRPDQSPPQQGSNDQRRAPTHLENPLPPQPDPGAVAPQTDRKGRGPAVTRTPQRSPQPAVAETVPQQEAAGSGNAESGGTGAPEVTDATSTQEANRRYRIRSGDTLASIAIMHYGDASKWRLIASANPTVNPRQLRIGQLVTLPPAEGAAQRTREEPAKGRLATHTVGRGDSLYSLAKRYYGDGARWPAIREANPGLRGASLHQIKLGSKLIIPKLAGSSGGD